MKILSIILLTLALCLGCFMGIGSYSLAHPPQADKGHIDLRLWQPQVDGPIPLNGVWEFYWSRLLTPSDFKAQIKPTTDNFINVPGVWNGQELPGGRVGSHGMATYRLLVEIPPNSGKLGLRLEDAGTAMRVFANGELIYQAGRPGVEGESRPGTDPGVVFFESKADRLELVVQVSNYDHRLGGMWRGIYLGRAASILEMWGNALLWAGLLSGALMIIGIYHLIVFIMSRNDRSFFYFGVFCLLISLRVLVTDDKLLRLLLPDIDWFLLKRIEYLTIFLSPPSFVLFLKSLYPAEIHKVARNIIVGFNLVLCAVVLGTSSVFFSYTTLAFYPATAVSMVYMIQRLWVARLRGRDGARALLWGFAALATLAVHDILVAQTVIRSIYLLPLGLVVFIFAQAAMLSYRNKKAFQTLERQRAALTEQNLAIEHENRQRQLAEQALRNSERRFRSLADLLPEPVLETDTDGLVTYANRSSFKVFGYDRKKLIKPVNILDTVSGSQRDKVIEAMKSVKRNESINGLEVMARRNDGLMVSVALYINAIVNDDKIEGYRTIILDITKRKKLELQLRQAQSLETVGTLAGGVAHDFNNILQAVRGYVQLVKRRSGHDTQVMHYLNMVEEESRRAAELTRRLLTFSRQVEPEMEPIDLNREVERVVELLRRTIPKMIQVEQQAGEDLWPVMADSTQIGQVLLNLCRNAADAMPDGGRLFISTENIELGDDFCGTNVSAVPGKYCKITVTDTGHGMDDQVIKHIFEPFYTSKQVGKGTGLGLAMVYGIVQSHKGNIVVYSQPGWGTTFEVYLPASPGLKAVLPVYEADNRRPDGHGRTILLVDDEASIIESTTEFLSESNYQVLSAPKGEIALDVYRRHEGEISAIVMDLNMPGRGGGWAVRQLRNKGCRKPILIVSGDLNSQSDQDILRDPHIFTLSKPYSLTELEKVINQMFDAA